jgi:hypothetical protein
LVILALVPRWFYPGTVEFQQDEANFSKIALNFARGREFPLMSLDSSVGIRTGAGTVYLMAIPYFFTSDPVIATNFVGLLGILTVLGLYGLLRQWYGLEPAWIAAALLAGNAWMVFYSRKIWNLVQFPLILWFWAGLAGFIGGRRWGQLWMLPLLSFLGQVNYSTVALIPIAFYWVWVARKSLKREFFVSLVLTVIVSLPFIIGAGREGFFSPDTWRRFADRRSAKAPLTLTADALRDSLIMTSGVEVFLPAGLQVYSDGILKFPDPAGLMALVIGVSVLFVGASVLALIHLPKVRPVTISLGLLFLTTPLIFTPTWTDLHAHYLLPVIPAAVGLIGAGLAAIHLKWVRRIGMIAACLFAMVQAWNFVDYLSLVDKTVTPGGFRTPLRHWMSPRAYLLEAPIRPKSILARVEGQYIGYHTEASVWDVLLYDVPLVRFADDNIEVYPVDPVQFLSHECAPSANIRTFPLRAGETCLSVQPRSIKDFPIDQFTLIPNARPLANGITPIRTRWILTPKPCLSIAWIPTHPVPEEWQIKVHFLDSTGKTIIFADGEFWRGRYWRAGDTIVRTHCVGNGAERASEVTGVRIGMYLQIEGQFRNLDFVDSAGGAVGQELEIPLTPFSP